MHLPHIDPLYCHLQTGRTPQKKYVTHLAARLLPFFHFENNNIVNGFPSPSVLPLAREANYDALIANTGDENAGVHYCPSPPTAVSCISPLVPHSSFTYILVCFTTTITTTGNNTVTCQYSSDRRKKQNRRTSSLLLFLYVVFLYATPSTVRSPLAQGTPEPVLFTPFLSKQRE